MAALAEVVSGTPQPVRAMSDLAATPLSLAEQLNLGCACQFSTALSCSSWRPSRYWQAGDREIAGTARIRLPRPWCSSPAQRQQMQAVTPWWSRLLRCLPGNRLQAGQCRPALHRAWCQRCFSVTTSIWVWPAHN